MHETLMDESQCQYLSNLENVFHSKFGITADLAATLLKWHTEFH